MGAENNAVNQLISANEECLPALSQSNGSDL